MKNTVIWELCPDCRKRTKHEIKEVVIREIEESGYSDSDEVGEYNVYSKEEDIFQIIECRGCERISYRQFHLSTPSEGKPQRSDEKLFPMRDSNSIDFKDFGPKIPDKIKVLYREVIVTFNNKLGVLCAAGIRAVIEGICNEKGIEGGKVIINQGGLPVLDVDGNPKTKTSSNLDGKIEGLGEKGFITKNYAWTLHNLRFLGNQAVHQLDKPNEENLRLAIDIIEHTLSSIYEIQVKAEKLAKKEEIVSNNSLENVESIVENE